MFFKKQNRYFLLILCIIIFIIFLLITNYNNTNKKDITATASQYATSGFFNKYRLCSVDKYKLVFSDSNTAIMQVQGMGYNAPHKTIILKLIMSKNNQGFWHVKQAEALNDISN